MPTYNTSEPADSNEKAYPSIAVCSLRKINLFMLLYEM